MATASTTTPVAPKIVTDSSYQWTVDPKITMTISTSGNVKASGAVVIELKPQQAPITVANMLAYVNSGFYSDVIFHRVISGFMIQSGEVGVKGSQYTIKNTVYSPIKLESNNGLSNLSGTIAMARTSDPNSASAQFFINTVDNVKANPQIHTNLDYINSSNPGYAVFGKVISGMSVIKSIGQVSTSYINQNYANVPNTDVVINSIKQTVAGSAITTSTTLHISDIASGASWSYSLDSGKTWLAGHGASIILPTGKYTVNQIEVKQTAAGVDSTISKFTSALEVDAVSLAKIDFSKVATTIAVSDTSLAIVKNLDSLQTNIAKITGITQTDKGAVLNITATQLVKDTKALALLNGGVYKLNVSGVLAANVTKVLLDTQHVSSIKISDTGANIAANLNVLQDTLAKITAITQTDKTLVDLKVSATQVRRDAMVLNKIGNYHLAVKDSGDNVYTYIADLHTQLRNGHISSISLTKAPTKTITASQFIANKDVLYKIAGTLNINIDASSVKPEKLDFSANVHGAPSAKHFDSITGWNTGDSISYSAAAGNNIRLTTVVHKGATAGTAAINAKGVATFDPKDNTSALKIAAVEKALGLAPTHKAGQFAMWVEGENTKVLIRDGSHSAPEKISTISAGDELIQLVGINPSHVHFDSAHGVLSYL